MTTGSESTTPQASSYKQTKLLQQLYRSEANLTNTNGCLLIINCHQQCTAYNHWNQIVIKLNKEIIIKEQSNISTLLIQLGKQSSPRIRINHK